MRIALYDGIQEAHLSLSLARALEARGHAVFDTGRFGHGFTFNRSDQFNKTAREKIAEIGAFRPDVCIVLRPASLPPELAPELRRICGQLWAWLCDDPVLWEISYREAAPLYDLLLHCGDADVLDMYESHLGYASGVNFPFWTDQVAFPYSYTKKSIDVDLGFLGNAQGELRRRRYHELTRLETPIRLYGLSGTDFRAVNGGYLDSDAEVVDAFSRVRAAVSIPQYFTDHRGLETWFNGLDSFGYFPFPSRIIQYASMGLPIFTIVNDPRLMRTFPEIITVNDPMQIDAAYRNLIDSDGLTDLSRRTFNRMTRTFSAGARALAIESLLKSDDWRGLSSLDRAEWFTQFDATDGDEEVDSGHAQQSIELAATADGPLTLPSKSHLRHLNSAYSTSDSVAYILGEVVDDEFGILARALANIGETHAFAATSFEEFLVSHSEPVLNPTSIWVSSIASASQIQTAAILATEYRVPLFIPIVAPLAADTLAAVRSACSLQHCEVALLCSSQGLIPKDLAAPHVRIVQVPVLVDRSLLTRLVSTQRTDRALCAVAPRGSKWASWYPEVADDLALSDAASCGEIDGVGARIAHILEHGVAFVPPRKFDRQGGVDWTAPIAGALGALVFTGRTSPEHTPPGAGELYYSVREPGELRRKMKRLALTGSVFDDAAWNSMSFDYLSEFDAEGWLSTHVLDERLLRSTVSRCFDTRSISIANTPAGFRATVDLKELCRAGGLALRLQEVAQFEPRKLNPLTVVLGGIAYRFDVSLPVDVLLPIGTESVEVEIIDPAIEAIDFTIMSRPSWARDVSIRSLEGVN